MTGCCARLTPSMQTPALTRRRLYLQSLVKIFLVVIKMIQERSLQINDIQGM